MIFGFKKYCLLLSFLFLGISGFCQQFMMQGWYWDYPKTAAGKSWADSLNNKVVKLKDAGFTHVWLPPHTASSFGQGSNGYDPKDLYIGNTTTGFGNRPSLDALLNQLNSNSIHPVADMVMNHRDGGQAENNPGLKSYIQNFDWNKANNGDNPFPSDRFRCILPLGGSSGNGAGDYYFKLSSASGHSRFANKSYKLYMQTSLVGYQNQPVINEVEPNGGGDCNQTNNTLPLGVDLIGYIDASGCTVDEFKVHLNVGDFNAAGDYLEIYMTNPNGDYSDHRFYGIWNASAGANVINQLEYQTYTDFSGLPSGQGEMHWDCFKPNLTNSTGLKGDQDGMYFFYDYDQNTTCARDALFAWAKWNCQTLGIKGFRLDAVKHFPADFVGDMLDYLHDNGIDLDLIVGEWYSTNTGELTGWVNNVLASMNAGTKAAMQPKIFDFALRESLRQACDSYEYDARNIFTSSLNASGLSGYNIVTFVNNHDFRDASGFASLVQNDVMLPYAYILTNNQLGVPCVFYPDYFGYYGDAANRSAPPPLKDYIKQLIKVHKDYIYGATSAVYLTAIGSGYSSNFIHGYPNTSVIYQLKGLPSGKDVVVAINFAGEDMEVEQNIETTGVPNGTKFTDVTGLSNGNSEIILNGSILNLKLKARSYAVWVEGENPIIPLPVQVIQFEAAKSDKSIRISGTLTGLDNTKEVVLQKSKDNKRFHDLDVLDYLPGKKDFSFEYMDNKTDRFNYYRLEIISFDGQKSYSEIEAVDLQSNGLILVNSITENNLMFESSISQPMYFQVFDVRGIECSQGTMHNNVIDVSSLHSGIYFVQIENNTVFKFIKK